MKHVTVKRDMKYNDLAKRTPQNFTIKNWRLHPLIKHYTNTLLSKTRLHLESSQLLGLAKATISQNPPWHTPKNSTI
jgi:hypothetical protein